MPDLPVAAPDPAAVLRHALRALGDTRLATVIDRETAEKGWDALDALLSERQQDKAEMEKAQHGERHWARVAERLNLERQQDKEELRRIAVMANELARDGLMPKGTAVKIRDVALAALGVRGDDAIQVLRGAALAVEEDAPS